MNEIIFLSAFLVLVALMLTLDLGVFHKKDHTISFKEAAIWTAVWIGTALLFYGFIYLKAEWIHGIDTFEKLAEINQRHGHNLKLNDALPFAENLQLYRKAMSLEYLTGYLIEKSLSIDNIFVMIMIFMAFGVDKKYYHRVLFYGILGAIVLRFVFIFAASALIQRFHWILLIFGGVLIFTGIKMFLTRKKKETIDTEKHPVVKFLSKKNLITPHFHGHDFFAKIDGRWLCTPLFVVLMIIEFSDVIFAFDSIPAIFSVTQDPYIVFFSNIFAILGLRSLFFMLESVMDKFQYLKTGLAVLLTFIGVKMLLPDLCGIHISTPISLLVIVGILLISILASIWFPAKPKTTN
ncbi:MAG: TerC family protein [Bacteroidales bacterium]